MWVSTHSHPKVAATTIHALENPNEVSTHSHPKVAAWAGRVRASPTAVSTHSHPKVAATNAILFFINTGGFNTQPPEGGCQLIYAHNHKTSSVSTHSHPKVAAKARLISSNAKSVSTHSHPKVAAAQFHQVGLVDCRFNTQPPEGGCFHEIDRPKENKLVSTHSHPKVAAYV